MVNEKKLADVIILARGGGSLEDLWAFNEEVVARAIYDSELPIISAIGHETDFTISDFVSDLRAPTPSAAAELAVTDIKELENTINLYKNRLKMSLKRKTEVIRLKFEKCLSSKVYKEPMQRINEEYMNIEKILKRLENISIKNLKDSKLKATAVITKLDTLSPLKTLARGYSLTESGGKVITKAKELKKDMEIEIKFQDGDISAIVI